MTNWSELIGFDDFLCSCNILDMCAVRSCPDFDISVKEPNVSNTFTKLYIVGFGGTLVFPNFAFSFLNVIEKELALW